MLKCCIFFTKINKNTTQKLLKRTNKKHNFNIYNDVYLKKKKKKKHLEISKLYIIFVILGHFLPFHPPNNLENQNFDKMKKVPEDVIILHMCTRNLNHDVSFLRLWSATDRIFCPLRPFFALLPH